MLEQKNTDNTVEAPQGAPPEDGQTLVKPKEREFDRGAAWTRFTSVISCTCCCASIVIFIRRNLSG